MALYFLYYLYLGFEKKPIFRRWTNPAAEIFFHNLIFLKFMFFLYTYFTVMSRQKFKKIKFLYKKLFNILKQRIIFFEKLFNLDSMQKVGFELFP